MAGTTTEVQVPLYEPNSREEEAEQSLKHTALGRGVGAFLCLLFLFTICSESVVQHVADFRARTRVSTGSASGRRLFQVYDVASLLPSARRVPSATRGLWRYWGALAPTSEIESFENALEGNSVTSGALLPYVQYGLTSLLGAGNEQAYLGTDRWLYYRPDVDYLLGRGFLEPTSPRVAPSGQRALRPRGPFDPVGAVVDLHRQLAARGVALVVVPVPSKPMIQPERLSPRLARLSAALQNPSYDDYRDALGRAGVSVFDVSDALVHTKRVTGRPQYLRLDTHWTPEAMELCAKELAHSLMQSGALPGREAGYYTCTSRAVTSRGDILDMLRLPKGQRLYPPQTVTVHQVRTAAGALWQPDPKADVLLLGDSFTNIYSLAGMRWGEGAGFAEQLSFALQRPVDVIARNAGGARASRQALREELLRGHDRLTGKRVVVYEFAMRDLLAEQWPRIELPAVTPLAATRVAAPSPAGVVVTGTIKEIASPPQPGSVPYRECLIGLYLTGVQATRGRVAGKEILVYTWGMKDNHPMPAAGYHAGQKVTLSVVPWERVEGRYGSYNRSEVQDEAALLLDVYWSE